MAGKPVPREDLSEAGYRKVGLSRAESAKLVEQVLYPLRAFLTQSDMGRTSMV